MGLLAETPVFVDTNLGTRFALSVPDNATAGDLKRKLKCEHYFCFPTLGKIVVHSLMVKKKTFFYHIPDSMPIKEACQGFRGTWFLRMDASKLTDMSMQQTAIPSSVNHFNRQEFSYQGETVKPNSCKLPASSNLISPSNSACCKPGDQVLCSKVDMDCKIKWSNSNMIDSSNTSKTVDFAICTVTATNMTNQAGKIARDCSTFGEGKVGVLSSYPLIQKSLLKRRKLGHKMQGNVVGKEAVITKKTYKSGLSSGLDSGKEVIKDNTMMDEAPNANQEDKTWLLEEPSERGKHKNSLSMEETPSVNLSEKISVTGLISRYFSNNDEVNSCSILHKNVRDPANATLQQLNSMLNVQECQLNEATGLATKNVQYSADNQNSNETESDCNTACSFNINTSETNQFCPMSDTIRKMDKNKRTASDGKRRSKAFVSSAKKDTTVAECISYQADNSASCGKKSLRTSQVTRKLIHATPHSTSRFSSLLSPFNKSRRIFRSNVNNNKCDVGKRLVQAANKICSSVSAKKSPKSRCISRCKNMCAPDSIVRLSFEINDSDD